MKIQLVTDDSQVISGFETIKIANGECEHINEVINHSCTEILAIDCLEHLSYDKSVALFGELLKKVRLGGTIVFRGLNLMAIGQQVISENLDPQGFSKLISGLMCVHDPRNIITVLDKENFLVTANMRGSHYEIKAVRKTS